jgi:hypothetical protein
MHMKKKGNPSCDNYTVNGFNFTVFKVCVISYWSNCCLLFFPELKFYDFKTYMSHLQNDSGCFNFTEKSPIVNLAKLKPLKSFPHLHYHYLHGFCISFTKTDWLIIYCCMSCSRFFHLIGDVTITDDRLRNLGLCSAIRAFDQGGIFIVPHLLWHRTSVFPVSSEGPLHLVAFYDTHGMWRIYSNPDPHGSPISHLLRHTKGCGGPILTRILMGIQKQKYQTSVWLDESIQWMTKASCNQPWQLEKYFFYFQKYVVINRATSCLHASWNTMFNLI